MNDKTDIIVINQIDYKEADAIITALSPDFDFLSLYVKGYKKITSKNVFATQLFDESEILFDHNENKVNILKSATLKNEHAGIKADYEKISVASLICEIIYLTKEPRTYKLLKATLDLLEKSDQPYLVLNMFLAGILKFLGLAPYVDGCCLCDDKNAIESLSVSEGGFICANCNKDLYLAKKDIDFLKRFRYINKAMYKDYEVLKKLNLNDLDISEVLINFLSEYTDLQLKSYKSLLNMKK